MVGRVAGGGPGRVRAEHHYDLAVTHVQAVVDALVRLRGDAHHVGRVRPRATRGGAPVADVAAVEAQELGHGAAVGEERAVAVGILDALDLVGDIRISLVPRDALPFVLAAHIAVGVLAAARLPGLALHGVLQAVGRKHVVALRTAADAGSLLRVVGAVLVGVVGLLADDHAVLHERLVEASTAAVVPTGRRDPGAVRDVADVGRLVLLRRLDLVGRAAGQAAYGQGGRGSGAGFDEAPSAQLRRLPNLLHIARHLFPPFSCFPLEQHLLDAFR